MAGIIGDWNVHPESRFVVKYSYRGGKTAFDALNKKLEEFEGLTKRIEDSPLGKMYAAMNNFRFGYVLPYHLLVRSVYTDRSDELLIRISDTTCRFGKAEFALITGLSFKEIEPISESILQVSNSTLIAIPNDGGLVDMSLAPFLGPLKDITMKKLETELLSTNDCEIAYKLGLIYFIEVVLTGKSESKPVSPLVFGLVDDTSRFLSYPWGRYFWDLSLENWNMKIHLMKVPPKDKEFKSDEFRSLMVALIVWGYETLPLKVVDYVAKKTNDVIIPRMLRWIPHKVCRLHEKTLSNLLESEPLVINRNFDPVEEGVSRIRDAGLTDDDIKFPPPIYPPPITFAVTHGAQNVSRDIDRISRHTIKNVAEEMRRSLDSVMSYVRSCRQDLMEKIDELRNDVTSSRESMMRIVTANRTEDVEENRLILAAVNRIWCLIKQQTRFDGNFMDRGDPQDSNESAQQAFGDDQLSQLNVNLSDEDDSSSWEPKPTVFETLEQKRSRVIFIERLEDRIVKFMNWYSNSKSDPVSLSVFTEEGDFDLIAHPYWFAPLLSDTGVMDNVHVDTFLSLLKRRMMAQPIAFQSKAVVLCVSFSTGMANGHLVNPALYSHVWRKNTIAYTLWEVDPKHWIVVGMRLEDSTLCVYDSIDSYDNKDTILRALNVWGSYMRTVVQEAQRSLTDKSSFEIHLSDDPEIVPMKAVLPSAIYAMKYVEDLVTVGHIKRITKKDLKAYKQRTCADLYCEYFGNYGV